MSILRKDPVSGGWVIIAEDRAMRPLSYEWTKPGLSAQFCPFCEGNESETPHEIASYRASGAMPNTPGWSVRTIPNKHAALHIEGELGRTGYGLYDMMNGIGAHEIIIETPQHDGHLASYPPQKYIEIIRMWRERDLDLIRDIRFKYIQIFRNYGISSGASLPHPHTQLIALPITPRWVKEELLNSHHHYQEKERCLFCDIIDQEKRDGSRVVAENSDFISFTPFASKFPFETWILPKRHQHYFRLIEDREIPSLGDILKRTAAALKRALSDPPYNLIIHSAPQLSEKYIKSATITHDYHWHIEIIPRVSKIAGFEWGTGFYINPVLPEQAAEYLREVINQPDTI